jgi:lipoprotein-anchoring transpeptidase ErfK/SrfK
MTGTTGGAAPNPAADETCQPRRNGALFGQNLLTSKLRRGQAEELEMRDRTKKIIVNLDKQILIVCQTGETILEFGCVSGDEDHATPTGKFTVLRKVNPCFSNEYKVEMDHALFFTNRGHAIHQSHAVGPLSFLKAVGFDSIGSHGCVRLSEEDATWLFKWAEVGVPIHIQQTFTTGA